MDVLGTCAKSEVSSGMSLPCLWLDGCMGLRLKHETEESMNMHGPIGKFHKRFMGDHGCSSRACSLMLAGLQKKMALVLQAFHDRR